MTCLCPARKERKGPVCARARVRVSVGGEEEEMSECNVRIRFSFLPFFLSFVRSFFLVALSSFPLRVSE